MTTANRFSALFTSPIKISSTQAAFPEIRKEPLCSTPCYEQRDETRKEISPELKTQNKKMQTKIILGHRSYEEDLREQKKSSRQSAYDILADKEKLTSSLVKSRMCKSVDTKEQCQHGDNCRFAHSLDELNISDCLFGQRCHFVKMSNGELIDVDKTKKVCTHKHPHENRESFMRRTGLDRYKNVPTPTLQNVVVQPSPPFSPSQPPPPPFSPSQPQFQLKIEQHRIETKKEIVDSEQILIIRVPKQLASQALEIAIKSGKSSVQIVIIE